MIRLKEHHDIRIDKDGVWYFKGEVMIRKDIVQYLYQYLKTDSAGKYLIETYNDSFYVTVEDAPYVIKSVDSGYSKDTGQPCIFISLSDGSKEELNLDTPIGCGDDNVMYCRVKKGAYSARFSRPAYYQFCGYIEQDSQRGTYLVIIHDHSYPLTFINHA